ncbi:MAG TPA: hypothetical protein PLO50_10590 [Nitrospira sp.]|nr:hypothetical protein [Nitrospira sp.]
MATYRISIKKVDDGQLPPSNIRSQTTEAQVNQILAGTETYEDVAVLTEVQRRGISHYVRACATGLNTSSIETAVSAVI